jgi:hypothetical protein
MIDPQSAGTVLGLANSAISAVKSAFELSKKTSDLELKHQISEVMDSVLNLKVKIIELDEENRTLRRRLEQKDSIKREPKHGFWLRDGETEPLCPRCYEGEKHLVAYLSPAVFTDSSGYQRKCNVCGYAFDSSRLVHASDFSPSSRT